MIITGKLYEVGNLANGNGRGICIESDGEEVSLTGLTEDECRELAKLWDEHVVVTIEKKK